MPLKEPPRRAAALRACVPAALLAGTVAGIAGAQAPHRGWSLGAQAIGLATHAAPAFDGRALTEAYLTQPVVMAHGALRGLSLTGTLNLEGWTLADGELNAGIFGEGYVDRRHPHTLVHEAVAAAGGRFPALGRGGAWSLAAGKGFVAYGTDDPMMRPLVKFPVNHHLSQLLERLVATAGVRTRLAMLELTAFNGDEPVGAWRAPSARRFGDSWAARATVFPAAGVELSASAASVASPEFRDGGGLDQRKMNAAVRLVGGDPARPSRYLLAEVARSDDVSRGRRVHRFRSALVEGAARAGAWTVAGRLERTTRPEEERTLDPFRSPRPHAGFSLVGRTRWDVATVGLSRELAAGGLRLAPLVEAGWAHATERVRPSGFVPAAHYGSAAQWSLSAGVRVGAGLRHARMGRYGVAADAAGVAPHDPAAAG